MPISTFCNQRIDGPHGKPLLLDMFLIQDDKPKPIVIFTHGFKGFKDWGHFNQVAERMAESGFAFVKYNGSHNGTTPDRPGEFTDLEAFGNNNFTIELDDLGQVIDWVLNEQDLVDQAELHPSGVSLIGHSRGGGIVILKANEDDRVRKIITWASVAEFGRFWDKETMERWQDEGVHYVVNGRTGQEMPLYFQLYENYFANLDRLHIPTAAMNLKIPHLIIHGTDDEAVPYSSAKELKSRKPDAELVSIDGAGHTFGIKHPWNKTDFPAHAEEVYRASMAFLLS